MGLTSETVVYWDLFLKITYHSTTLKYTVVFFYNTTISFAFLQVSRILYSFSTAFKRSSKQASDHVKDFVLPTPDSDVYTFSVSLEVKEDDGKGNFR